MIVHHCCVLLHLPFPRSSYVLLWFLLLLWIWLLEYYTRNVYSFGHNGVVELYWRIQQWSNGGDRVLGSAKDCWARSKLECVLQWAQERVIKNVEQVLKFTQIKLILICPMSLRWGTSTVQVSKYDQNRYKSYIKTKNMTMSINLTLILVFTNLILKLYRPWSWYVFVIIKFLAFKWSSMTLSFFDV
jgi:hypothetical protein